MQKVVEWRRSGIPVCYTIDAGPNVHVITVGEHSTRVVASLMQIPGVGKVLVNQPGKAATLSEE
jgi:diphosphomevalonate decarboxylase